MCSNPDMSTRAWPTLSLSLSCCLSQSVSQSSTNSDTHVPRLSHTRSIVHMHRPETDNPGSPSRYIYHVSTARSHAHTRSKRYLCHIYISLARTESVACTRPLILPCTTRLLALPSACQSEQAAAAVLGYRQVSWDNESGQERQPWQSRMIWASMTSVQRRAVVLLGFTQDTWDGRSEPSLRPASYSKKWSELTACGE